MKLSYATGIGQGKFDRASGGRFLHATCSRVRVLRALLVLAVCALSTPASLAAWIEGHWEPAWVPEHTESQWQDGHWEDQWIDGYFEQQWVDGYWEEQWIDGYWDNQWVEGYWDNQWTDGYWEEYWTDGYWDNQWVDGYWEEQWRDGYWDEWGNWVDGYWEWVWTDGYWNEVWVDGYWSSNWVDGYWSEVWVDGYWNNVWVDGYWNNVWVEGYWDNVWIDAHWTSIWVEGGWVDVVIPGYWEPHGTWIPGHWDPPLEETWQPFDEIISGWYPTSGWSPDPASVPSGQSFTQTRALARDHRTGERNDANEERYIAFPQETGSESRPAVGTGLIEQSPVSSNNGSIALGSSFEPGFSGGSGTGGYQWCVAGYTNWGTGSWTAGATGTYEFWVRKLGDGTYNDSAPAGPYSLTVSSGAYNLTVNGGSGGGSYSAGQTVSIAAGSPPSGQVFNSWSQSGPGTLADANWHQTQFTMGAGAAVVSAGYRDVNFDWGATPPAATVGATYNVSVGVDSGGMPYVTLYKNGAYFSGGWFGTQGSTSDSSVQTVNYDASFSDSFKASSGSSSRTVEIHVSATYSLSTSVNPVGAGSVSGGGVYQSGATATLTASASGSYTFTGWSGGLSGAANPANLVMTGNTSVTANFTSLPPNTAPTITSQPQSQTVAASASAVFAIAASGNPAPTYQWRRQPAGGGSFSNVTNGGSYSGATTATLTVSGVTTGMSGDQFRCVALNSAGEATSNPATLSIGTGGPGVPSGPPAGGNDTNNQNQLNVHLPLSP